MTGTGTDAGATMKPLSAAVGGPLAAARFVFCDLDDTLTLDGRLPAASYAAMERLQDSGRQVVVVTGRPAGWCDLIARFWPVAAVVGENGAFYFRYDHEARRMVRRYQRTDEERARDRRMLDDLIARVRERHPDLTLSADQAYRVSDVAIDFCEDVDRLPEETIADMVAMLEAGGATVKISSIHINAWIGSFSKLEMTRELLREAFGVDDGATVARQIYVGDSPNDEPMFAYFDNSVGVANVARFLDRLTHPPKWVTNSPGGLGFAELVDLITARP